MVVARLALVLAIASALFGRAAAAEEAARLEATLHYNGRTLPLTKMLVLQNGNEEGLEDGPHLRIYLSDGEIPVGVAGGAGTLRAKAFARDAGISGVVILADPAGKSLAGATFLLNARASNRAPSRRATAPTRSRNCMSPPAAPRVRS